MKKTMLLTTLMMALTLMSCGRKKAQVVKTTDPVKPGDTYLLKQNSNCGEVGKVYAGGKLSTELFIQSQKVVASPPADILAYAKELYKLTAADVSDADKEDAPIVLTTIELKSDKAIKIGDKEVIPSHYLAVVGGTQEEVYEFIIDQDAKTKELTAFSTSYSKDSCVETKAPKKVQPAPAPTKADLEKILSSLESSEKTAQANLAAASEELKNASEEEAKKIAQGKVDTAKTALDKIQKEIASAQAKLKELAEKEKKSE